MKKAAVLAALLACTGVAFSLGSELTPSDEIAFNGLTGTLENIIASRSGTKVMIGSYSIYVDDLIDEDIASVSTCDSLLKEYLDGDEECNYGQFSDIIRQTIIDNFDDKSGFLFTNVTASEEVNIIHISIAIDYGKTMLLPVYIETVDEALKISFTVPCTVEYSFAVNFEIDSDKVLNGTGAQGVSIEIEQFMIELKAFDGEWNHKLNIVHDDAIRDASIADFDIHVAFNWYLCDAEGNDPDTRYLSYEQIGNGEYAWQLDATSSMSFSIATETAEQEGDSACVLRYVSDDLSAGQNHSIEIIDNDEASCLPIRMLLHT
jgi:hypothetical protein